MTIQYLHLQPGQALPNLALPPFRVAVVIEAIVGMPWRIAVCDWLAQAGCRYLLAWGPDCSLWDDVMDETSVMLKISGELPEDHLVMTTWLDEDTLAEFMAHCKHHADHPDLHLRNTLLLHIGAEPRELALLRAYEQA